MRKDQLQSLFQVQIKVIHEEIEEALGKKVARQRVYRRNRFLECLCESVVSQFESVSSFDVASVQPIDLALKIWPHANYDDHSDANRELRVKILRKYKEDFNKVSSRVYSRILELGFDGVICPFADDSEGSNRYGIRLDSFEETLAEENKVELSQVEKFSGSLMNVGLPSDEIIHYEEIELPKSVWPTRIFSTKFKLEMVAAIFFFVAALSIIFFLICSLREKPNLMFVFLSGLMMYFSISVFLLLCRGAYCRQFSAPVFMWRPTANIPVVIVKSEKVGRIEASRLMEVKNVVGKCPVCCATGISEDQAIVFLKPKLWSWGGQVEGVCSYSNLHKYDFESVGNVGVRKKA